MWKFPTRVILLNQRGAERKRFCWWMTVFVVISDKQYGSTGSVGQLHSIIIPFDVRLSIEHGPMFHIVIAHITAV